MSPRSCSLLALLALALLCGACTTTPYRVRKGEDEKPGRIFALYRIEIDHDAVKAGAPLFFTEPTAGVEFGHTRKGGGQFAIADSGVVRTKVSVIETSTNYQGRPTKMGYVLMNFSGRMADEGGIATIHDGDRDVKNFGDRVDAIKFDTDGADKLVVQPLLNGKPQAYRFHFTRSRVAVRANVDVPWN
jgi:hypothetical protein